MRTTFSGILWIFDQDFKPLDYLNILRVALRKLYEFRQKVALLLTFFFCVPDFQGDLGPEWIPIMVIFMVQQWVGIFGLHIVGIRFNEAMRRPNKYLLPMPARRKLPLRISLLMARYLEAFHTKKRYGIGYGVLGIISMANFLKVISTLNFILD